MALFYIAAGLAHFLLPSLYERIMPVSLTAHHELVILSGIAEIAGGIGVLVPAVSRAAAWGLIALLCAIFPANVSMLERHQQFPGIPVWILWARLPLQLVWIWWAWLYTKPSTISSKS